MTEVKRCQGGICAVTDDGSVYQGNIIVGADGVHSRIRSEMWRMANKDSLGSILDEEKKSQYPERRCP